MPLQLPQALKRLAHNLEPEMRFLAGLALHRAVVRVLVGVVVDGEGGGGERGGELVRRES